MVHNGTRSGSARRRVAVDEVLRVAARLAAGAEPAALATVVGVAGSTPRHVGARMLVHSDGRSWGTIGGGRIELEVTRDALEVAAGGAPRVVRRHLVRDLAMCCGGAMDVLVEPVASSAAALAGAVEALERREPRLLITPLDGSGKSLEALDAGATAEATETGAGGSATTRPTRPVLRQDALVEPLLPAARLVLFGAGHVARAVGPVAAGVGFEVIVCDDNETGELDTTPAWANHAIASFDVVDVEAELGPLGLADYALIVTRDHAIDQRILETLAARDELTYLGLIGSRGKVGRFRRRLVAKEVVTERQWARLRAPVGLDIGAETPAEIAVAIVGELIAVRNRP